MMKRIVVSFFYFFFFVQFLNGVGQLPVGMGQTSVIWGVDHGGKLFVQRSDDMDNDWKFIKVPQKIRACATGRHLSLWALMHDHTVLMRKGISADNLAGISWIRVKGMKLKDIAVGSPANVCGITLDGRLVVRTKITNNHPYGLSWELFDGVDRFKKISLSARDHVWALTTDGRLLFQKNASKLLNKGEHWKVIDQPQPFKTIEVGNFAVWALDENNHVWVRTGISLYQPEGRVWKQLGNKKISSLSVGSDDAVWGVHEKGILLERRGITPTQKVGYAWKKIPGKLFKSIATTTFEGEDSGGRSYTHKSCEDGNDVAFHHGWRFKKRGTGWACFASRTKSDLYVYLSPERSIEKSYKICIKVHPSHHGWISYWVRVRNGLLSWGKQTRSVNVVLGKIKNNELFNCVKYIGFGGKKGAIHEYKNIQIDGMSKLTDKAVVLPREFARIDGKAQRVAVGCLDDRTHAISLGFDNKLYTYDELKQVWQKMADVLSDGTMLTFQDVSVASDGSIVALDEAGRALRYDQNLVMWRTIEPESTLRFDRITVGNKSCIWALDKDSKNIYQLTSQGWHERAMGDGMSVDAGADGTVVVLNTAFDAYVYDTEVDDWQDFNKKVTFGRIAVGSKECMWATHATPDGFQVWRYDTKKWKRAKSHDGLIAQGLKQLSVNDRGDVFALDLKGNIYKNFNLKQTLAYK